MPAPEHQSKAVTVFIAYSHTDEALKDELIKHLSPLKRQGLIDAWHDRRIMPGAHWESVIDQRLDACQIVLPLISPDFVHSEYCYGIELQRALQRDARAEARVIPVILRPCDWTFLPFAKLQALPKDGKPVTTWSNQDEAFLEVVRGLRTVIGATSRPAIQPATVPTASSGNALSAVPQTAPATLVVTDSPLAVIWDTDDRRLVYVPVRGSEWADQAATLELEPDDSAAGAFLDGLRGKSGSLVVAYRNNTAMAQVQKVTHVSQGGVHRWKLEVEVRRTDFTPTMEPGIGGVSKEELAEERARRVLFNENPTRESRDSSAVMREVILRGVEVPLQVERSALPVLFQDFGHHSSRFLQIAWIDTVMRLKLSACVAEILMLRMQLEPGALHIRFHGRRKKEYTNRPGYEMKFEGKCKLT